ncbi:MAG TPA: hypothetical protein VGP26_13515 [Actinophytocola sp.]|nr:hypothetical protein [Actinophytocola sp.]
MSHYVDAVEPAFAALALAEGEGVADLAAAVRLDLAACSREVGEPLLGCAVLRPVLDATELSPSVRAVALGRLVGCVAHVGRRDDIEDALTEADRLLASDDDLSPDARRLERARLSVRAAAYHRWYGDTEDAADAAREGLTQLNRVRGRRPETARLRAQLVLELACALLDDGALEEAVAVSEAVLAEPVRATSAAAVGQLMLAVSTRVHLPSGRVDRGRGLLDQAVWVADRHGLDGLLADVLTAVSQLDEAAERTVEALESLRGARAAEQRRLRAMSQAARHLLTETSPVQWDPKSVNALLRAVLRAAGHQPATKDWHLAAQRVTQPSRQAAQPAAPASTSGDQAWPTEQPTAPGLEKYAAAGERVAGASVSGQPTAPTPDEPADVTPTAEPAAAADLPIAAEATEAEPAAVRAAAARAAAQTDEQQDEMDAATGLLSKDGLIRRLRSVRNGERPVALTLVRLDSYGASRFADPGTRPGAAADFELSELAGRVRNIAPENAELARSDGTELAVLLPHTTRDQAEKFAAAIESAWLGTANGHSISTGVVQSNAEAPAVDARALINAARHALTPAAGAPNPPSTPSPSDDLADMDPGDTLRIGRAIISSLSIPAGSGGKRRAEDTADPPQEPPDSEPGYSSSTYEQTKAELARLMTALNTKKDPPPEAFEPTPLPAPSRPAEDHPRNGTALPSQSIPTPPDPSEIPEPEPRPDIPDPFEPDPIPPAPPDTGPESPPDTGPLTPPGNEVSAFESLPSRRRGATLPSRDSTGSATKSGDAAGAATTETRSTRRRRGGLAAAFGARSEGPNSSAIDSPPARPRMTLAEVFAADDPEDDPAMPPPDHAPSDATAGSTGQSADESAGRTANPATGYPVNWAADRTNTHSTSVAADRATDRAANHATSNAADESADRAAGHATGAAADGSADRAAGHATGDAADRLTDRAAGHATGDAADRLTDRAAGHATGAAADPTVGLVADSAADRELGRATDRDTDRSANHAAPWATDGQAEEVTGRRAGYAAGGTIGGDTDHTTDGTAGRALDRAADHLSDRETDRSAGLAARWPTDRAAHEATGRAADYAAPWPTDRAAHEATTDRAADYAPWPTDRATEEATGRRVNSVAGDAIDGAVQEAPRRDDDHAPGGVTDYAPEAPIGRDADHVSDTAADLAAGRARDRATNPATDHHAADRDADHSAGLATNHVAPWATDHAAQDAVGRAANHAAPWPTDRAPEDTPSRGLDYTAGGAVGRVVAEPSGDYAAPWPINRAAEEVTDRAADEPLGDHVAPWSADRAADRVTGGRTGRTADGAVGRAVEEPSGGHVAPWPADRAPEEAPSRGIDFAAGGAVDRAVEEPSGDHAAPWSTAPAAEEVTGSRTERAAGWVIDRPADEPRRDHAAPWPVDRAADRATGSRTERAAGWVIDRNAVEPTGRGIGFAPGGGFSRRAEAATDRTAGRDSADGDSADREIHAAPSHAADATPDRTAEPIDLAAERPSRRTGQLAAGQSGDRVSGQSAERFGGRAAEQSARRPEGNGGRASDGPGSTGERPGAGRGTARERRAERSAGSTTIAGLLAEALAAYQETSDEPDPEPRQPVRDNEFERLFDWRYQSPASGRHRSPE